MAKLIIKLDLEDIQTSPLGNNIRIECRDNVEIVLTQDAVDELLSDIIHLLGKYKERDFTDDENKKIEWWAENALKHKQDKSTLIENGKWLLKNMIYPKNN